MPTQASTSNAHVFYRPYPASELVAIDLGQAWSNRPGPVPQFKRDVAEAFSGRRTVVTWDARRRFTYVLERFDDRDVMRQLHAFEVHALRGGLFSIAEDGSKCWASYLKVQPVGNNGGRTSLTFYANQFDAYTSGGVTLASGDEIFLRGPAPEMPVARCEVSSVNGNVVTVTSASAVLWDLSSYDWILGHHVGFWPMARVPKEAMDTELLTHDHEIHHTFTISCEESPDGLAGLAQEPSMPAQTAEQYGDGGASLEDVITEHRAKTDALAGNGQEGTAPLLNVTVWS